MFLNSILPSPYTKGTKSPPPESEELNTELAPKAKSFSSASQSIDGFIVPSSELDEEPQETHSNGGFNFSIYPKFFKTVRYPKARVGAQLEK